MASVLAKLLIKLGLDKKEFDAGIDGAKKKTDRFGSAVKKMAGILAGAFAVDRLLAFGKELLNLGGIAQGVSVAFERIAGADVLTDLQEATKGTVSELELMKRAVMASNFNIPVEQLASLFKFATKRAQETGESVDYLVNSIVLGIGRKSPLILDNLGISAVDLRQKLEGVGHAGATVGDVARAVGEIAEEAMAKSGAILDTTSIKLERNLAKWDDVKTKWGEVIAESKKVSGALDRINSDLDLTKSSLPWLEKAWFRLTWQHEKGAARAIEYDAALAAQNETTKESTIVADEFNNLLGEVNISAEENTKIWKKKFEAWEKQNKEYAKSAELLRDLEDAIDSSNQKLNEGVSDVDAWFDAWVDGAKKIDEIGGGGVFDMFTPEEDESTSDAEEMYQRSLDNFRAFKEDFALSVMAFGTDVVEEFGSAMGEFARSGEFPEDFGSNVLSIIGKFISGLGKQLIALGIASEAFQLLLDSAFSNPYSAAATIAAGAVLVALGGAIGGYAKAGPTGSGVSGSGGASISSQPYTAVNASVGQGQSQTIELNAVLKGDSIFLSNERNTFKRGVIG